MMLTPKLERTIEVPFKEERVRKSKIRVMSPTSSTRTYVVRS